jgi:hypothetical protein
MFESNGEITALRRTADRVRHLALFHHAGFEPGPDQA